ncbi:hypothetical protein ID866_6580 [Astraeus odoratus]|nr:hypothetical protein ID866_6580 [Astraeus odoratus]
MAVCTHLQGSVVGIPLRYVALVTVFLAPLTFESLYSNTSSAPQRANATFIILCRNSELDEIIQSVREIEDRFNRNFSYPYVFLNDEPFTEDFKWRVSVLSPSLMEFGVIPHDHWYQPSWIDEEKAAASRKQMEADGIIYGGMLLVVETLSIHDLDDGS